MSASLTLPTLPLLPPPMDLQPQPNGIGAGAGAGGAGNADGMSEADAFADSLEAAGHGPGQGAVWDDANQAPDLSHIFTDKLNDLVQVDEDHAGGAAPDGTESNVSVNGSFSTSLQAPDGTEPGSNVIGRMPGIEATDGARKSDPRLAQTQRYIDQTKAIGDMFVGKAAFISVVGAAGNFLNTILKIQ